MPTDEWDLETNRAEDPDEFVASFLAGNEQFDRSRFYVRATNKKDHSTSVRVALPRSYTSLVDPILRSDTNPLRSAPEAYRHALVYGLLHLAEMTAAHQEQLHRDVTRILLHERVAELANQQEAMKETVREFSRLANLCIDNGDEAAWEMAKLEVDVQQLPDRLVREIERVIDQTDRRFQ